MPRCPAGTMDEGPVDLRTRPKATGPPGAALPLRKRPLRAPSPEPAAPRVAAGPVVPPDPLRGGSDTPAVPAPPHGLARPEAIYYQGPLLSLYPTPTMGPPFPLLNLPTPLYPMVCSMEHPLSADFAMATRADEDGDTPLHIAVVQGNLPAVHRLVNLFQHGGRELDIYNNLRQTPLHLAVITTLPSVVRLLVMAGASPMALDRHGQTAAHLACEHRSPACLRALLDSAPGGTMDLEARNYDGLTALHVAVNTECQEAVLLLLEHGADIDAVDIKSGRSPLIHAVENNSLSMVQLLLQAVVLTRASPPAARRQRERADVLGQLGAAFGVRPRAPPARAHAGPQRRRQRPQELPQRHTAHGGAQPPGHRHPERQGHTACSGIPAGALSGPEHHHVS
ncbi:B-cell lymphoma 3 protein isoform X2 [Bos indicus]|uniref:B-cell lymphoma 3 protein isoform X2 n=1 Tax=Bos indicus TaxID=9915 RepID=A0ABM4QVL5_BOSIN